MNLNGRRGGADTGRISGGLRRPAWLLAGGMALLLTVGLGALPVSAAVTAAGDGTVVDKPVGVALQPTATCPQSGVDEIQQAIEFVQGKTWAEKPGGVPLNISPDLTACKVTLNVGKLSKAEEAALIAGAGSRLAVVHRRDWARPSHLLLILWIVFGGSGLIWMFRRYARQ